MLGPALSRTLVGIAGGALAVLGLFFRGFRAMQHRRREVAVLFVYDFMVFSIGVFAQTIVKGTSHHDTERVRFELTSPD